MRPATNNFIISANLSHLEQLTQIIHTSIGPVSVVPATNQLRIVHLFSTSHFKRIILTLNHAAVEISRELSCAWPESWRVGGFPRPIWQQQLVDPLTIPNLVRMLVSGLNSC